MHKNSAWQSSEPMIHSNYLSPKEKAPQVLPSQRQELRLELMDVRGLAGYLALDRQTIYNWLHQNKLTGIKVGGVWRFDRRVIDAWLQERTVMADTSRIAPSKEP